MSYYNGCKVELEYAPSAKERLARVIKKIEADSPGVEVSAVVSPTRTGITVKSALVPHGHPANSAGTVDAQGKQIESWGPRLLLISAQRAVEGNT